MKRAVAVMLRPMAMIMSQSKANMSVSKFSGQGEGRTVDTPHLQDEYSHVYSRDHCECCDAEERAVDC